MVGITPLTGQFAAEVRGVDFSRDIPEPVAEQVRRAFAEHSVLVFRNEGHGGVNVVYRREDGNIGWIDPVNSPGNSPGNRIGDTVRR